MSLLQQLIQLLSETPGNIIYHLLVLFAAQATLAMAWWAARRDPHDRQARQLVWAAGGILLTRLTLLGAYAVLAAIVGPGTAPDVLAAGILPPLEQAINAVTAIFLAWALVPRFARVPHLTDAVLVLLLLLAGTLYGIFAPGWLRLVQAGLIRPDGPLGPGYNASPQTIVWAALQISVLVVGLLLALRPVAADRSLRVTLLGALALAHFAHLWNYPELVPSASDIAYWIRFGQMVAMPLLVTFTYRHVLRQLLASLLANRPRTEQMSVALRLATPVVRSLAWHDALAESARLLADVADVDFSAVAVMVPGNADHLHLVSERPVANQDWLLRLNDWPAFRLALEQVETVELAADGMGARQLSDLSQELGLLGARRLLVEPLSAGDRVLGMILLARQKDVPWAEPLRDLAQSVAHYVAVAMSHAREQVVAPGLLGAEGDELPLAAEVRQARDERDSALAELQLVREQLAAAAETPATGLASSSAAVHLAADARVSFLEGEIIRLQQALAAAQAAIPDPDEDPEAEIEQAWAKAAVERTALALDEAQSRIRDLERRLAKTPAPPAEPKPATPPSMPASEPTETAAPTRRAAVPPLATDPREAIEAAISALDERVRERRLRVYLDLTGDFPHLQIEREKLFQIMTHLLENACQASPEAGHVAVRAQAALAEGDGGSGPIAGFIQLTVQDSGPGIPSQDRARVFEPHFKREHPPVPGIGDTGIGLSVVHALVQAHGGRVWVEGEPGAGSIFKVLLPISASGNGHGPG